MRVAPLSVTRLLALWVASGVLSTPLVAAPYTPSSDAQVLAQVAPGAHHEEGASRLLARGRLDVALPLAKFYIEQARSSGDLRFLGYAEAVLAPWVTNSNAAPAALVLQATLQQSRHDFSAALLTLERALALRPDDVQAWLTRATVLRVMGRYVEATAACAQFAHWADASLSTICEQSVLGLSGHLSNAYAMVLSLPSQGMSTPERSWRAAELGDMAVRLGRDADAERWFRDALSLSPRDFYVRAAYADLLLRQQRSAEVLALLKGQESIEPLLLRLAIAQRRQRDPALTHSSDLLRAAFAAESERGEAIHRREQARFLLEVEERPSDALAAALANWMVQREPDDLLILVQAARAAGAPAQATPALDFARSQGLEDARLTAASAHT